VCVCVYLQSNYGMLKNPFEPSYKSLRHIFANLLIELYNNKRTMMKKKKSN